MAPDTDWLLACVDVHFELGQQVLIGDHHVRVGQQQNDLNQGVVDHPKRNLLEIVVLDWRGMQVKETVNSLTVYKVLQVVAAPSELQYFLLIFSNSAQDLLWLYALILHIAVLCLGIVGHLEHIHVLDGAIHEFLMFCQQDAYEYLLAC